MNLISASSSTIGTYAYSAKKKKLFIEFKSGQAYVYHDVPEPVFKDFQNASSLGSFHATKIKLFYAVGKTASYEAFCRLTGESPNELKRFNWVEEVEGEACCL